MILHYLEHHDPTDNDVRQIARLWDEDPLPRGVAILEVGAHDEPLADALATMELGYRVTGIDLRPYPGTIPKYEHRVADVLATWLPRAWYDAVFAVSTIEHVGLAEFGGIQDPLGDGWAMRRIHEALRLGGRVYLTVPIGATENVCAHWRRYTRQSLRERLIGPFGLRRLEYWWTATAGNGPAEERDVDTYTRAADLSAVAVLEKVQS